MPILQLIIIIIVVGYFAVNNNGLSAFYGGLISLINTLLIDKHTKKQEKINTSASVSVKMMNASVIKRMFLVIILVLVGLNILKLSADALIVGLVFGQIGFLIDRVVKI